MNTISLAKCVVDAETKSIRLPVEVGTPEEINVISHLTNYSIACKKVSSVDGKTVYEVIVKLPNITHAVVYH